MPTPDALSSPPQDQIPGGASFSIPPTCSVPKAPEGKTLGAANINQEPGWLATVAQGLLGTAVAVRDDHPAQLIEAGSLDQTGGGCVTSFEQKISEARQQNKDAPDHVIFSDMSGIDTPYNDHFRVVGKELTARQLGSARPTQYSDKTGAIHDGWVTSEGAADITWSREGKLVKAVNTHATYDTEPGFVASLLNPVDLLSGAIAGKVVGRTAVAAFDAIAPKAARSAAKGVGPVKAAASWIKRAALRLVSRGAAQEAAPKITSQLTREELNAALKNLVPKGKDLQTWGGMIWGSGEKGALRLIGRTRDELLKVEGLTLKSATQLRDIMLAFQAQGLGGAAPVYRVQLLNDIIKTLGG